MPTVAQICKVQYICQYSTPLGICTLYEMRFKSVFYTANKQAGLLLIVLVIPMPSFPKTEITEMQSLKFVIEMQPPMSWLMRGHI